MADDRDRDSRVAESVVYVMREGYGLWGVSLDAANGILRIASVRDWKEALSIGVQKACVERADLLLVDAFGTAEWVSCARLRAKAREWGIPVELMDPDSET